MKTQGKYYGGKTEIWQKTELWRAVSTLLTERSKKKVTMKDVRNGYTQWIKSDFCKTMSFVDFVKKLYSGE